MSAVPKKKLCWNCDGNVARNLDNCPYCGVYVQNIGIEEENIWNPTYKIDKSREEDQEEVPKPSYQVNSEVSEKIENNDAEQTSFPLKDILTQFKFDFLPILFLMGGSVFTLFGTILLLFSEKGTLTLQWDASYWTYFLVAGIPFLIYGWYILQKENE